PVHGPVLLSVRRQSSPCDWGLVTDALPFGAHFATKSAIHAALRPLKACVTGAPAALISSNARSRGEARRYESPARHAVDSPTSPPTWPNRFQRPTPLRFGSLAGKLRPRPSSVPSSTKRSVGAIHFGCTPSSFLRPLRNALYGG